MVADDCPRKCEQDLKGMSLGSKTITPKTLVCKGNVGMMPEASINDAEVRPADALVMC